MSTEKPPFDPTNSGEYVGLPRVFESIHMAGAGRKSALVGNPMANGIKE